MRLIWVLVICSIYFQNICGQSVSFETYMNPVIPGDHPDPTLTRIGDDFFTSGSSFNPTPKIYHSTDLVHWEVVSQPVSASWSGYGDEPGGGIWGGHMVLFKENYWHFFGRGGGSMYFVTANQPEGPWSNPTRIQVPAGMSGLGVDNSIFIDDETGKWYLLTKAGRENNHIVELGEDGQPTGVVLDLTWLNPDSEGNPYGWAEGPVMWKNNGYYYYSFAQHLVGEQYVMRSDTLTDDESAWTIKGNNIFTGSRGTYNRPNHISPVVTLDNGTSWTIVHSYHSSSNWYAHGRQGLLCKVTYNEEGFPVIQYPPDDAVQAPDLPSNGIPWMVPKSDMFDSSTLNPEWSFLGYTSEDTYSLSERPGWLRLSPRGRLGDNTVIKNDGEHNFSLITRVDFEPETALDEAGLWIFNGPETMFTKVFSTQNSEGKKVLAFSFDNISYGIENTIGSIVWLKLVRSEHMILGFYSSDGFNWSQIGEAINAEAMDNEQTQFNNFTGNQQGLYVKAKPAYFDLYIYRDAYSQILAESPANQYGTTVLINRYPPNSLMNINNNDWALYTGVEFGNMEYQKSCDSISLVASCAAAGGDVEVYIDSIDASTKVAVCSIGTTASWTDFKTFTAPLLNPVLGNHDVYLKFTGSESDELFQIQSFQFITNSTPTSIEKPRGNNLPQRFYLNQNYPNPFNPLTTIEYSVPRNSRVSLKVYDFLGREVATLVNEEKSPGIYEVIFNGSELSSSIYLYRLRTSSYVSTKKLLLLK